MYRPIKTESDYKLFQRDINKIVNWISDNHLTINVAKTKCMTISRLRSAIPLQVEVNGHQLYKSQVLPILDYTSVVWEPHLKKDKLLLGAVQLQATRMASKQENSVSLNQRFELQTLESRCKYLILLIYKFLNGYRYTYCPMDYFIQHPNPNPRLFHSKYLVQP